MNCSMRSNFPRLGGLSIGVAIILLLPLAAAIGQGASGPAGTPAFTDVTAGALIDHVQWNGDTRGHSGVTPYLTGGAAAGDYDGDGWDDLFVTRLDAPDILYRNLGNGQFADVSSAAGFTASLSTNGAAWGDIDNDGDLDLYVTSVNTSQFYLYVSDGEGHFHEQAVARGAAVPTTSLRQGFSASLGDFDRDGYLDIHTTDWGIRGEAPRQAQSVARLLHNRGAASPGYFDDVTEAAGVSLAGQRPETADGPLHGTFAFNSRFADFDDDGWPDLAVTGDFQTSRLFWNNRDGTFSDGTVAAGVATDENGMGSAFGDYDGDGDVDWFVTSIYDSLDRCATGRHCDWGATGNRLFRNDGDRQFSDQTDAAGVRDGAWGWGAAFLDYDNDGNLDLVMTNGMDVPGTFFGTDYKTDPMRLWRNDPSQSPRYAEVASDEGVTDTAAGKGLLTFDYDRDGDLDLFVVNNRGAPVLYRNNADGGAAWLQIDPVGVLSNRDGIGARVLIDPDLTVEGDQQMQEIDGGSHFLGQSPTLAHFGLGDFSGTVDLVRVWWPSGRVTERFDVAANQRLVVVETVPEPAAGLLLVTAAGLFACGRFL